MKKVLSLVGSAIILGGFLAFSLQSTGKLTSIGGKTKCVKMNETLNQWKTL